MDQKSWTTNFFSEIVQIISNSLILINDAMKSSSKAIEILESNMQNILGSDYVALGQISSVPAATYAKASFEALDIW